MARPTPANSRLHRPGPRTGTEETLIFARDDPLALSEKPGWFAFPVNDAMVNGVQTMIDEVERVRGEMMEPDALHRTLPRYELAR